MKMFRLTRRTPWILVGLSLGWYAAGLPLFCGTSVAGESALHEEHGSSTHDGHDDEAGDSDHAVRHLVPRYKPGWLRPVLWTIAGLFVAAVLLGPLSLRLRGPEPPDPAEAHGHDNEST